MQALLGKSLRAILGEAVEEYTDDFGRRAMADLAFVDTEGMKHVVDVKTHAEGAEFSMPNLVSVARLAKLYDDDITSFDVLLVRYREDDGVVQAYEAMFVPIEWLDWNCLTLGALGHGQIQIADARKVTVRERPRSEWMCSLCDAVLAFYPREIEKLHKRIARFEQVRAHWQARRGKKP